MKLTKELANELIKDQGMNIVVPNEYLEIEEGAFAGTEIESISMPSVEILGFCAFRYGKRERERVPVGVFQNCTHLRSVFMPKLEIIGVRTFQNCITLNNVTLHDKLYFINTGAFRGCGSLSTINIPRSVIRVGPHIFRGTNINCPKELRNEIIEGTVKYMSRLSEEGVTNMTGRACYHETLSLTILKNRLPIDDAKVIPSVFFKRDLVISVVGRDGMVKVSREDGSYDYRLKDLTIEMKYFTWIKETIGRLEEK